MRNIMVVIGIVVFMSLAACYVEDTGNRPQDRLAEYNTLMGSTYGEDLCTAGEYSCNGSVLRKCVNVEVAKTYPSGTPIYQSRFQDVEDCAERLDGMIACYQYETFYPGSTTVTWTQAKCDVP